MDLVMILAGLSFVLVCTLIIDRYMSLCEEDEREHKD